MILFGPHLLIDPKRTFADTSPRKATWLIGAALTAAVWPAAAVVLGHVGSAALGKEEASVAVLRAAVGFIAVVGGALVAAPALSLLLLWLAGVAHEKISPDRAGTVAMYIVWPVWASGMVLAVPPLFGLGPELGELIWAAAASIIAIRAIRVGTVPALAIRRRWKTRFIVHSAAALILVFALVSIAPAMAVRSMMGASTPLKLSKPESLALPLPPEPNW